MTDTTNNGPVAGDDTATTDEDTPVVIHVLANDTDADNDPLSIGTHTLTEDSTLTLNADGTFAYSPNENYYGTDEFTYTATVHITIQPVNDPPTFDPADAITALDPASDGPAKIVVSPDSSHVYLSSQDSTNYRYVANVFDPAANSVISVTLPARFYPYQPSFNSDGSKLYLPAGGDYTTGYPTARNRRAHCAEPERIPGVRVDRG